VPGGYRLNGTKCFSSWASMADAVFVMARITTLPPREAMRHQLEMFARAVRGEADYPIPFPDLLATVASFEATVKSVETSRTVEVTRT